MYVDSGGVVSGTSVSGGGDMEVSAGGAAEDTTVAGGGILTVDSGGTTKGTTLVNSGGLEDINGTASGTIVLGTSGAVGLEAGAAASGAIVFAGTGALFGVQGTVMPAATISGFAAGDTIALVGLPYSSSNSVNLLSNNELRVTGSSMTFDLQLDPNQSFSGATFSLVQDFTYGGTDIELLGGAVCFCRGTRILSERGEVAVEDLAVGDRVVTLSGGLKPIRWIGMGCDLVTRRNSLARPLIVRAGALADMVPRRDLYLTHGHALHLDGVLIPVEHLVNHRSILWDEAARVVEYYHIELDDHDVVFAEGATAESYYDAGNRAFFQNAREGSEAGVARPTFAPVRTGGEIVETVWASLFDRAGGQVERATTDDPDLHLVIAGDRIDPAPVVNGVYTFALAAPPTASLLLSSRSAVPSLIGLNRHEHRRLGVAIRQIILSGPGVMTCLDHDALALVNGGCHLPEGGYSWTDGKLVLPPELFAHLWGAFALIVHTQRQGMRYPAPVPVEGTPLCSGISRQAR